MASRRAPAASGDVRQTEHLSTHAHESSRCNLSGLSLSTLGIARELVEDLVDMGRSFSLLITSLIAISGVVSASSFYDNPDQDPRPAGNPELEELEKKWGTDVRG